MKKGLRFMGSILIFLILLGMAYVRVAPMDPEKWHLPVTATENADLTGGAVRVIEGDAATLAALDKEARSLKRTRVLAGSVAQKHISYVTRSAIFGFPDVTTIDLTDGQIRMFARLRFGQSDMGVNRSRLEHLIASLK